MEMEMEMEGRGYSEFYRNTSEELFIKSMMESPVGIPAPTMEMLGFKNFPQNLRTDSEELFTNGEQNSGGFHSTGVGLRPRQASRRISTELAASHKKVIDDTFSPVAADSSNSLHSTRTALDKGLQATNLFMAKAWFQSSQPMTRSRSSELRRRYVAMHNSQTPTAIEAAMHEASAEFKLELTEANGFNSITNTSYENAFMSPSSSSSSTLYNPQLGSADNISSVVSMLKGTLERKNLSNHVEKHSYLGYYNAAQVQDHACFNQEQGFQPFENEGIFQDVPTLGAAETRVLQTIQESLMEDIMGPLNPTQMSTSESSAAAPVVSNGFDPCISTQAPSVCESSRNQMGTRRRPQDYPRTRDFREHIYENSREDQKQGGLARHGSIKSTGSVERGDPTKKRRVERSRKMAEAKERSSTPPVPSDMQSMLKRSENLEKEVRSLKLNLAFMNRKDSEQTKLIEQLEKQNQGLLQEKGRLLEEIERIVSQTGNM